MSLTWRSVLHVFSVYARSVFAHVLALATGVGLDGVICSTFGENTKKLAIKNNCTFSLGVKFQNYELRERNQENVTWSNAFPPLV